MAFAPSSLPSLVIPSTLVFTFLSSFTDRALVLLPPCQIGCSTVCSLLSEAEAAWSGLNCAVSTIAERKALSGIESKSKKRTWASYERKRRKLQSQSSYTKTPLAFQQLPYRVNNCLNDGIKQHVQQQKTVTSLSFSLKTNAERDVEYSSFFHPIVPPANVCLKLFLAGSTVGPLVDGLHNQCLLRYDLLPINIPSFSGSGEPFLSTSWLIPPLLGFAYVVLGGILPRLLGSVSSSFSRNTWKRTNTSTIFSKSKPLASDFKVNSVTDEEGYSSVKGDKSNLTTAILAVMSSALIIRLSYVLEVNHFFNDNDNVMIMTLVALMQWFILDRTPVAFVAATITSIGGPLSELPFVAQHCWTYLPEASNYFPLEGMNNNPVLESLLQLVGGGEASSYYQDLALSKITGPCYFAVTTDAIALGRWFDESKHG